MQSSNDTISLESIFANAEQQAQSLIERITAYVNERVNDIDAAENLVLDLSNEAARFNKILISIDNTNAQVESGDITKEEAIGTLAPLVKELKEKCTALRISGAELSEDDDIDVNEIAVLREIIIGAKAVVEKRVADLRTNADLSPDTEGFSLFDDDAEPATESIKDKINEFKQNRAEAKEESKQVDAKADELRAMAPEKVAALVIKAITSSKDYLESFCKLSKDPEAKELVEKTASEWAANPGKINPTTTKYMTIAGYPAFVVTKKDKKTGNEVFAAVGYSIQLLKDQVFAGRTIAKAGAYDVDAIFGCKEAARVILGTPLRNPITKKRMVTNEAFLDEEYVESLESVIDVATEYFENIEDASDYALEAVNYRLYSAMKKSTEAQTAKTLLSNAKKLFNMGSREKAIEYMKKAQALYQKCLDRAKKEAKMVIAERTVGNKVIGFGEDRYKREVTDDFNAAALINYFEDRVDTCKAYILKWRSKNAQSDLKSLKQSLKQERKSERDRIRDQKRANKATESYTNMEVNTMNAREFYAVCENYVGNLDNEISAMCLESYEAIPEVTFTDAMESAKGGRLDGIKSKVEDMKAAIKDPKNAWKVLAISLGVCVSCLAIVYAIQKKVGKQPWTTSVFNSVKKSVDKVKKLRSDARQKKTAGNNTAAYPQEEATKALHEAMAAATNTEKITKLAQKARVEQSGASNYYANNDGKVGEKDTRGTAGHGGKAPEMDLKREGSKLQNQPAPAVRKNASAETRQYLYDMDSVGESFNLFEDDNSLDSALESAINSIFDD